MTYTYLAHHGIKGQKWGVRRYQNPDGTLTEEGRKRYLSVLKKEAPADPDSGEVASLLLSPNETYVKNVENTGVIPKGSYAYRVTTKDEPLLDNKRKYVSLTESGEFDYRNLYYEGALGSLDFDKIRTVKYEATKNLKVATSREVDDFIASIRPDTIRYKTVLSDLSALSSVGDPYTPSGDLSDMAKAALKYMDDASNYLYKARKDALFSTKYDEKNPVFKHFIDLGYDAISDVEDGGIGAHNAWAPAIILNPAKSLKVVDDDYIR